MEELQAPTVLSEDLYDVSYPLPCLECRMARHQTPAADHSRRGTDATSGSISALPGPPAAGLQR